MRCDSRLREIESLSRMPRLGEIEPSNARSTNRTIAAFEFVMRFAARQLSRPVQARTRASVQADARRRSHQGPGGEQKLPGRPTRGARLPGASATCRETVAPLPR